MKSIGTQLTLMVVVFPILLITLLSTGVFYIYRQSLEALVVVEVMSTLSSVVLVDLLVWERLRDSLSKKLDYFHENYLLELHKGFNRISILYIGSPTVERIKRDLKRYGKFMGISLYPKDLPNKIDTFLISYGNFKKRWEKLRNIGKEQCDPKFFDEYLWAHVLGIKILHGAWIESHSGKPKFKLHLEKGDVVIKEHAKLIEDTKECLRRAETIQDKVLEKLQDFFKSNNLEFRPEKM